MPALVRSSRRIALRLVSGGDAERGQHCYQRVFWDVDPATAPVFVIGGDPVSTRKFDQRRRHLAHTDILLAAVPQTRSECSPRRRLFEGLGLLPTVRCAATI